MESLKTYCENTPYIALFGGQATPWHTALSEAVAEPIAAHRLENMMQRSDEILAPVLNDVNSICAGPLDLLGADTNEPFASVPGIFAAQVLAYHELALPAPAVAIGHSQGVLAADFVRGDDEGELFALARLIGAAATFTTRMADASAKAGHTPMASIRGITEDQLQPALAGHPDLDLAIRNGHRFFTVSGRPEDLAALEADLDQLSAQARVRRDNKEVGGTARTAVVEYLPVAAPFHSRLLEPAVDQVCQWARVCGLTINVERLARAVLTDQICFDDQMREALETGATWIIDFGPGQALNSITQGLIAGRGIGLANAGSAMARDRIATPGYEWERGADWSVFAPRVARVGGKTVLDTRFSRLTGRSPILLAGMTPTTVEPDIVAAAANAGYWAELAGGGQVTEEIFLEHVRQLREQLEPGRAVQFNTMFMDPYLWGLHFGRERIVSRERANGAPFDGVVISAGIPPVEDALDIVDQLRQGGFPYVSFKPGTVAQIRTVLAIAKEIPNIPVIIQVEDGRAGGHHSWEDMEGLLAPTYGEIRQLPNTVLVVGGGLGVPEHAATFLTGTWSEKFGAQRMPVDAILVGTAAMAAQEAHTSPSVKQLLVDLPGITENDGWVASGSENQAITSGLSHLLADIHEVENASARAGRLILSVQGKPEEREARRDEIIEALSHTAKPYFGDVTTMTYDGMLRRYVELAYPWVDVIFIQRFHDMLQRVEARLNEADHGLIDTIFPDLDSARDPHAALDRLSERYPGAATTYVTQADASWFIEECRTYPKPVPFVPALDDSLLRWWASDNLWQSHDERYDADSVRIIPGPVSVAGITRVDEPVAQILRRFESVAIDAVGGDVSDRFTRMSATPKEFLADVPHILWHGRLVPNPVRVVDSYELVDTEFGADLIITFDQPQGMAHSATSLTIPLILPNAVADGGVPVVDEGRLDHTMRSLLSQIAGVGAVNPMGETISALPQVNIPFGQACHTFTYGKRLGVLHAGVTANTLHAVAAAPIVPSALLGMAWPAIYAAFGSATYEGASVLEGFLGVVHLDHAELLDTRQLREGARIEALSRALEVVDSSAGRIVTVVTQLRDERGDLGSFTDRFAIRGRAQGRDAVDEPSLAGGNWDVRETKRSRLRTVTVTAPTSMEAFAQVSGDYNPIHTSSVAARLAGLDAPIVHGMWLDAAAQHAVMGAGLEHGWQILGWTYRMFGMVNLGATIEIAIDRIGRINGGGLMLEVTSKVDGNVVSVASAAVAGPTTAYVYPGQGIQKQGMTLDLRASSAPINAVWERADAHTRTALGFSILAVVRDNPASITAKGVTYRHPKGVLNLTQFTQVALATVAFAQTEQLRAAGAIEDGSYFAGHSLGEYNALCAYGQIMDLETVLDIVFYRGSTMHNLVPRNEDGSSNYRLGALRPNQFGLTDADVAAYVASVAEASGEFLEIVNYNLLDEQYAVAGTVAGLDALAADAQARALAAGGKGAFMLIPGIDVPFHSSALREGVDEFRTLLDSLLPEHISCESLQNKYVPNLVARPFALTREFFEAVLSACDSPFVADALAHWESIDLVGQRDSLTRALLIELLAYQFASPVRWIETQDLLLRQRGVERFVEVGLGQSPTLANMAAKTLKKPAMRGCEVEVLNLGRDTARVMNDDVVEPPAPAMSEAEEETPVEEQPASQAAAQVSAPSLPAPSASAGPIADLPLDAPDALRILLALENKVTLDQIGDADTLEILTGGVSSKRNQVLMDMSAELTLPSIDGAADLPLAQLASQVATLAHSYRPFGPVLSDAVAQRLRRLFGAAGVKPTQVAERLSNVWNLGAGWAAWTSAVLLLDTREGTSTRGGELATLSTQTPTSAGEVDALIDAAVERVGALHSIAVAQPSAGASSGGVVDSAALDAFSQTITSALEANARDLLDRLGKLNVQADHLEPADTLMETVSGELGSKWPEIVQPRFDAAKAVRLNDRWATAREDVARIALGEEVEANFIGTGEAVARQAEYEADRAINDSLRSRLLMIARDARDTQPGELAGQVAVVTGMTPASIAGGVVRQLLARGATVIATASNISTPRLLAARQMYRHHARGGAELWLVPANLASYRDIDALAEWIGTQVTQTVNAKSVEIKPALTPDLFFPFAAPPVYGTMDGAGAETEIHARVMLWGVERLLTRLAVLGEQWDTEHRMHVVLPGSPNRGLFGGDGGYGEVKAAFDAILNKWRVEPWGKRTTVARARIGWVRGTGLMGGNDPLVTYVESQGVTTYSTDEMADKIITLAGREAREDALDAPLDVDFTGGLGNIDFAALLQQSRNGATQTTPQTTTTLKALPHATSVSLPTSREGDWDSVTARPQDTIVIVGYGEVGPWGSSRTRFAAELGVQADGSFELTAAGVLELAWGMGLLTWHDTPKAGWYNTDDELVDEADIYERYVDEVVARCGIRELTDRDTIADQGVNDAATVFLDRPVTFSVADEDEANAYVAADPQFTTAARVDGEWQVTRAKGATALVPKRTTISRYVAGQMPAGFDPQRWGIPASMLENADLMASWNLVTAVDAFLSSGFTPAQLLAAIHPTQIASTQGTGFGGMESMRKLFLERFRGENIPQDTLQETLANVIAAHTMQAYVGGYGSMVQPVSACATAAVSIEEGVDKIRLGKATFAVTGAIDALSAESLEGFGLMNATASSAVMEEKGINHRFFSRAGDLRRGGFVEAEGGGTVLIARGDLALELGLPVYAVVGYVQSFADGAHTSIPAPGLGALGAGLGGTESSLMRQLRPLGVEADDLAVVSKHDTSTNANDPNEAELHVRLAKAIGRHEGNPLYVISQKTLTGHAKGGAALFQIAGLTQVFATGIIPANRALDNLDPVFEDDDYLVWLRDPLALGKRQTIKAALATSLGFGHVSSVVALVHPGAFEAAVAHEHGHEVLAIWRERSLARRRAGHERIEAAMMGHAPFFEEIEDRRFASNAHETEARMLLDPSARLGENGYYA